MRMMTAAEEKRLADAEARVTELLERQLRDSIKIKRMHDYIMENCQHSALGATCLTCSFLKELAK